MQATRLPLQPDRFERWETIGLRSTRARCAKPRSYRRKICFQPPNVRLFRESLTAPSRPENRTELLRIRIFPTIFSGARPIVSLRLVSQTCAMKIVSPPHLDLSDRLILLRRLDSLRNWESLDEQRFCRCCHKFISGRQIEVIKGAPPAEELRPVCPTNNCSATPQDWVYPNEIAQPPDAWGRRVIRVVDKNGERFIVCGKTRTYSRRRLSRRSVLGSTTAA